MYETILVPLDGSHRAEAIMPHVEELAQRYKARVVFMQVVEPESIITEPSVSSVEISLEDMKRRTEEAKTYLATWQGEFREKGIKAATRVEHGPVVQTIIDVAEGESADLIAMASHGRGGITRVFYGSVAAGVLQRVDRPILVIRARRRGD